MDNSIVAIILAAGKGSRMNSTPTQNKVTQLLAEKPMIAYTVDTLIKTGLSKIVVVVGFAAESVKKALGNQVDYVVQENPQGTGHAVKIALENLTPEYHTIVSMYGDDSAFYSPVLLDQLITTHTSSGSKLTIVSIIKANPTGLGRIIRDESGNIVEIVEEKNATESQKQITEINTGLYCFDRQFLTQALQNVTKNPISGEYYLTDVVGIAKNQGIPIHSLVWTQTDIWHGVNTLDDLKEAEMYMNAKSKVE